MTEIDCGDNSCMFATNKGGMRTNGGCRCLENAGFHRSQMQAVREILREVLSLRSELHEAREELERIRLQADPEVRKFLDMENELQREQAARKVLEKSLIEIRMRPCNGKKGCPCCVANDAFTRSREILEGRAKEDLERFINELPKKPLSNPENI